MQKILVDTSIIIDFLRRKDKVNSLFYQVFTKKNLAVISLTTITELWAGKSLTKRNVLAKIENIVSRCEILIPNIAIAKQAGRILRETNYEISFQDAQVAAQAIDNSLPLLTLNEKDFRTIKGIKLFKLN